LSLSTGRLYGPEGPNWAQPGHAQVPAAMGRPGHRLRRGSVRTYTYRTQPDTIGGGSSGTEEPGDTWPARGITDHGIARHHLATARDWPWPRSAPWADLVPKPPPRWPARSRRFRSPQRTHRRRHRHRGRSRVSSRCGG
jgi:hypothetical protein